MAKPGPKSANELLGPIIPGMRPPPPDDLDPAEKAAWQEITARLPMDWFTGENAPMLKELCRHIGYANMLAGEIAAIRSITGKASMRDELQALLRAHGYQSERIGNLSTKLRLTKQSRWSGAKADQQARKIGAGPKPWEDWGDPSDRRQ
jgi:hypothetical protein